VTPLDTLDRFRGCLIGLAVGDALGTTAEFKPRGTFAPVTDMTGGGHFRLPPGYWTDDTSMALCLAESLVECEFDLRDQIERYCRWYEEGYWSSTGSCFDIGNTTRAALERYRRTGHAASGSADPSSAGNGCIMRLAPVPMYFFPDEVRAVDHAASSCITTHGALECLDAAKVLAAILLSALRGADKNEVLTAGAHLVLTSVRVAEIAAGATNRKSMDDIRGSGYVVECLEAAVWCYANTETFADAVLAAVNLGDDADTTAAVCGQIAGAWYGQSGIPTRWLERLHRVEAIRMLADRLYAGRGGGARRDAGVRSI
jgi:ADP-ribosyl-[dinitrogen reductase] hydrolase